MQAEVVPLSKSGTMDGDIVSALAEPVSAVSSLSVDNKPQETKPLKIDLSAFCDCV